MHMKWLSRPYVRIGRGTFFIWAGSWSWAPGPEAGCPCCTWNYYVGPFGFEWAAR